MSPVTDKTGITQDKWYLEDQKINHVMNELTKVGQYFKHPIPTWVNKKRIGRSRKKLFFRRNHSDE